MEKEWRENSKGNFTKKINGIICTVFLSNGEKGWTHVYDGCFSRGVFETAEEAMQDAVYEHGGEE